MFIYKKVNFLIFLETLEKLILPLKNVMKVNIYIKILKILDLNLGNNNL